MMKKTKTKKQKEEVKPQPEYDTATNLAIGETIQMFQTLFPIEFAQKKVYAVMSIRHAVHGLLQVYTKEQIRGIIEEYARRKSEQFAPSAGTICEFCTYKFSKIEQFLNRKSSRPHLQDYQAKNVGADDPRVQEIIKRITPGV